MMPTQFAEKQIVKRYSNRSVPFRFDGTELRFHLSLALFSSYDIDTGSKLLLKSLAREVDFSSVEHVYDLGCGVGVLGIALGARHPHLRITLQDRDALATAFSRVNAEENGVSPYTVTADIAFLRLPEDFYDLIVSNIPAKAGEPVLRSFIENMIERLSPEGRAAIVVVETLAKKIGKIIGESGGSILLRENGSSHSVFHFRSERKTDQSEASSAENGKNNIPASDHSPESPDHSPASADQDILYRDHKLASAAPLAGKWNSAPLYDHEAPYSLPRAYFRTEIRPRVGSTSYSLDTVWGLADFDNPGYRTQLFSKWVNKHSPGGRICVWNPGQGHIPTLIYTMWKDKIDKLDLAGRDTLALAVSTHNLLFSTDTRTIPAADIDEAAEKLLSEERPPYDLLIIDLEHLPSVERVDILWKASSSLLSTGGTLLIIGKSSDTYPYTKGSDCFSPTFSQKQKGLRVISLVFFTDSALEL